MKKKLYVFLASVLVLTSTDIVMADTTATKAGTCDFNGSAMNSSFDSNSIAATVSEMEPGDAVSFGIDISNSSDITTSWYMSNDVISSLEDAQAVAENGGYTYKLTYTDFAGTVTVLYDSDSVGGEKVQTAGKGLNEATDSLDELFFLDVLESGEKGTVDLYVLLDGESQGNIYQDTLAKLKMNFAVEEGEQPTVVTTTEETESEHETETVVKPKKKKVKKTKLSLVKTGDVWMMGSVICLFAGVILIGLAIFKIRKEER